MDVEESYPERLLPRPGYHVKKVDFNLIKGNVPAIYLQRGCDVDYDQCCVAGDPDEVTSEALGKFVFNLSISLLGTEYQIDDVKWVQKGASDWVGEEYVPDFSKLEKRAFTHAVYIKGEKLHEYNFNFPSSINIKSLKDFKPAIEAAFKKSLNDLTDEEKTDKLKMQATISISHIPTTLNYWHYQATITVKKSDGNKTIKDDNPKWLQKIRHEFTTEVCKKSSLRVPERIYEIDKRIFLVNP